VAERHATVHAARALFAESFIRADLNELLIWLEFNPFDGILVGDSNPLDLEKTAYLAHQPPTSLESAIW
jgi:hypothetical protein